MCLCLSFFTFSFFIYFRILLFLKKKKLVGADGWQGNTCVLWVTAYLQQIQTNWRWWKGKIQRIKYFLEIIFSNVMPREANKQWPVVTHTYSLYTHLNNTSVYSSPTKYPQSFFCSVVTINYYTYPLWFEGQNYNNKGNRRD